MIEYEWSESKSRESLAERGYDFSIVHGFDWTSAIVTRDERYDYGEVRFRAHAAFRASPSVWHSPCVAPISASSAFFAFMRRRPNVVASDRKLPPPSDFDPAAGPVTDEEMATAMPASEFFASRGLLMPRVGRPRSSKPSQQVTLRIHPDTIAFFKASGAGWQRRMLDVLDKEAGRPKKAG